MAAMTTLASAEYKFVDAEDDTGYYVDMATVKIEGGKIDATIAVVKASLNKLYEYEVTIKETQRLYQIKNSKILEYDSRKVLETNNTMRAYRPYSARSQMSELVKYIKSGGGE